MATVKERNRTKEQELEIRLRWSNRQIRRLERENQHLEEVAYYDVLTRESAVLTRFGFIKRVEGRIAELSRDKSASHCLLYIDLDDFKIVNDQYGHQAGDMIIQAFAVAVQDVLRGTDIVGRIGGDEFAIVARVRGEDGPARLTARVKRALSLATVSFRGTELRIKASIGTTTIMQGDSAERVLDRADQLMYEDKSSRKNTEK